MTTYTITLQNCAFFARHGVHDEEEFLGQRFFVDAELDVVAGEALESDLINDTVNYGIAFTVIEQIVTGKRRYLIEVPGARYRQGALRDIPADPAGEDHGAQAERARAWRARFRAGER